MRIVLRILRAERVEETGEWRELYNEELNDLYCSHNVVRVIKWRRMRWAGHVARMGDRRGVYSVWSGNLRERSHWGYRGVDGKIILRGSSGSGMKGCGLDRVGSG